MSPAPLVDTHCHLLFGDLGQDPDAVWRRAQDSGVEAAIVIGIDPQSSRETTEFVATRDGLHASVGIHPNSTGEADDAGWDEIRRLSRHEKVVALGETGLDLHWKDVELETQRRWLERHVELALEADLPLVLHIRDAHAEAREALQGCEGTGVRAVLHCFGGTARDLHPFVSWGWMVSFAGNLTYPSADALREAAAEVPIEQCLVETDAPWLAPVPRRGRTNEPAFVAHVVRKLADVKGLDADEVAAATTSNARRFFRL